MNFSDSEIVASVMTSHHAKIAGSPEDADVILLNTCSIRDNAEQRVVIGCGLCSICASVAPAC